jgi:hypothetical protein
MVVKSRSSRWADAISSMIELTQDGKLLWRVINEHTPHNKERTTPVFQTTYLDKELRLYEMKLHTNLEGASGFDYTVRGIDPPKWFTKVVLEFIDAQGRSMGKFPEVDALSDLLTSVQYQAGGVNDFLNRIISETHGTQGTLPVSEWDVRSEFKKRGDALNRIIKILDDATVSETERLKGARAAAADALLTPEF